MKKKLLADLAYVEEFLELELENRSGSGLVEYIQSSRQALAAFTRIKAEALKK